jgi:phospholipid/cholesterol/gamma-HCH transport system permease protein
VFSHLAILGRYVLDGLRGIGEVMLLFVSVLRWLVRAWRPGEGKGTSRLERQSLLWQMYFVGVQSLPVIATTGAFTGMVLAYSTYFQLQRLDVTSWTGPLLAKSLVTQLGPVLAGLMLAGRVGCAMTAELGTMAVTEQIDACYTNHVCRC